MLSLSLQEIIYTIINIIIFYLFLRKFLFKPVTAMMDKRTQTISDSLDAANAQKEEAAKLYDEYAYKLSLADAEANKIIKEARDKADWEYNNRMVELEKQTAKIMEESNKAIELEKQKAVKAAQDEIAAIAILATSKIIGKNVDSMSNRQLLGDFMKEVGAAK